MEYSEKTAWLKRYRDDLETLRSLNAEAEEVRSIADGISINWSGMPGGSGGPTKAEKALEALEALMDKIEADKTEIIARRAEIKACIESVQDERQRNILRYRYINGFSWPEVSGRLGYDQCYIQRVHRRAVEAMEI